MRKEKDELKAQAKKLKEHKKLLRRIVSFVEKIVLERGEVVSRRQGSCYTRIIREFGFGKFKFASDSGQSMTGGDDVYIYYCDPGPVLVFQAHWQSSNFDPDDKNTQVLVFQLKGHPWLAKLEGLMKNPKNIISKIDREKEAEKKRQQDATARNERQKRLEAETRRLKLA